MASEHYIKVEDAMQAALWSGALYKTLRAIEAVPSADVVPVVRCGACKHNYGLTHCEEWTPGDVVCDYWMTDGLHFEDFCSKGEKAEGSECDGKL